METNTLKYTVVKSFREKGITYKVITTIKLHDECKNGTCSWSITGDVWVNPYKESEERHRFVLSDEEREEMEGKILSGYYTESAIQERKEAERIAKIEKRKNEVIKTFEKRINKATKEKDVKLAILGAGLLSDNYIYYVEGNQLL